MFTNDKPLSWGKSTTRCTSRQLDLIFKTDFNNNQAKNIQFITICGYSKLRHGTSIAFFHRSQELELLVFPLNGTRIGLHTQQTQPTNNTRSIVLRRMKCMHFTRVIVARSSYEQKCTCFLECSTDSLRTAKHLLLSWLSVHNHWLWQKEQTHNYSVEWQLFCALFQVLLSSQTMF